MWYIVFGGVLWDGAECLAELGVVYLYSVVEVYLQALGGEGEDDVALPVRELLQYLGVLVLLLQGPVLFRVG